MDRQHRADLRSSGGKLKAEEQTDGQTDRKQVEAQSCDWLSEKERRRVVGVQLVVVTATEFHSGVDSDGRKQETSAELIQR